MAITIPSRYERFNTQQTKQVAVVVKIDGVADVLTSRPIYTRILYGEGGIVYGQAGMVYGGLRPYVNDDGSTYRDILSLSGSSLSISQKIEPESGKGSVSSLSLAFIDKDGYMTELISPGVIVEDILGREIEVFLGFEGISYPQDYLRIFRGFISGCESGSGMVTLTLADPNLKRKKELFYTAKTRLTSSITSGATTIPVAATTDFHFPIFGPDGSMSQAIKTYIKIGDEIIRTNRSSPTAFGPYLDPVTALPVTMERGARGTAAAAHDAGADVTAMIEIEDNAMDLALRIMLSGWNGPYLEDVEFTSIGQYPDPYAWDTNVSNEIYFPPKVDVREHYGLSEGDFIAFEGLTEASNNFVWYEIISIQDIGDEPNRLITVSTDLFKQSAASSGAVCLFRSKYDTLPVTCGMKLTPRDIDVEGHTYLRDTFLAVGGTIYTFLIGERESSGKDFIETQLYRPVGAYSLTRRGLLSVGLTKPPLADQNLVVLSSDNILNPQEIKPTRSVNGRSFYNEVDYYYDHNDAGEFTNIFRVVDSDSLSIIGLSSILKIESRGTRSDASDNDVLDKIAKFVLSRYKRGAVMFSVRVNWEAGSQIEAGDVVAVRDGGLLKITNFATGERDLGTALFEVVDRSLDIKSGHCTLKLVAGIGAEATDRFATIAPASVLAAGSTASKLIISDSYGEIYPDNEPKKWQDYEGQTVLVHADDWSYAEETTFTGIDPINPYALLLSPPLGFVPAAGDIVEISNYSASVERNVGEVYKVIHAHLTPTVTVVDSAADDEIEVDSSDLAKFSVNCRVRIHREDYTTHSGEAKVTAIDSGTNILTFELIDEDSFTPVAGDLIELIGFPDGGGAYRWI